MENLFNDTTTINAFKQIQYFLLDLSSNSGDEEISSLISKIPPNIINSENNLMVVCRLFAYYARDNLYRNVGNAIKLFEKILEPIKTHLKKKSSFFWNIFGGLLFFKLWMYEENLIFIEDIIRSARQTADEIQNDIIEYFLPEIIENEPEIFEIEIKNKIDPAKYSKEYLEEYKELRKKYFTWIRNSNDYNDSLYREIEKDPLRLSIKMDDVDKFQSILSNTNLDVNAKVTESIIENIGRDLKNESLISYAIEYSSIKIIKYLIMHNAELSGRDVFRSIRQRNYEVIHLVESNIPDFFEKWSFLSSISCWNEEIIEYSNDNYPLKCISYDGNVELDKEDENNIRLMILYSFFADNFIFLDSYLLPILRKYPKYIEKNIYNIICASFLDDSCYFLKELLKYPGIDINYCSSSIYKSSLLIEAIKQRNENAVEVLLKMPKIDINLKDNFDYTPFKMVCIFQLNLKVVMMFCRNPDFDIHKESSSNTKGAFDICIDNGNSYTLEFLLCRFPELINDSIFFVYNGCITGNHLLSLKILLKHHLMKSTRIKLINDFMSKIGYNKDDPTTKSFIKILDEL